MQVATAGLEGALLQHSRSSAAQAALPATAGLQGFEGSCSQQGPAAGAVLAAVAG